MTTKPTYSFVPEKKQPRPYVEIRVAILERKVKEQYHMLLQAKKDIEDLKSRMK